MSTLRLYHLLETTRHAVNGGVEHLVEGLIMEPRLDDAGDQLVLRSVRLLAQSLLHDAPDVLDGVKVWGIAWPGENINAIGVQELSDDLCFVAWSRIVHENALVC